MAPLVEVAGPWTEADLADHAEMSALATNPLSVELGEDLQAAASSAEVDLLIVLEVIGKSEELLA